MNRFAIAAVVILALAGFSVAETREEKAEKYIKQLESKDAKARASAE